MSPLEIAIITLSSASVGLLLGSVRGLGATLVSLISERKHEKRMALRASVLARLPEYDRRDVTQELSVETVRYFRKLMGKV